MFTIRLRKGSKSGAKVGEFGRFATQAEAIAQAQILADSLSWAPGIKVVVEKVRGGARSAGAPKRKTKTNAKRSTKRKNPSQSFAIGDLVVNWERRLPSITVVGRSAPEQRGKLSDWFEEWGLRPGMRIVVTVGDGRRASATLTKSGAAEIAKLLHAEGALVETGRRALPTWLGGRRPGQEKDEEPRGNSRKNSAKPSTSTYKGHQIRRSAAGYTVLPYGHVFPSLTAARAWLTQHVAAASKRNPKGGRLLAAWGKRAGRAVGKTLRSNAMTSYKGHAYNINAGVYSTKDPLTGKRLTFRNRLDLEHFLDRAFMARARSARGTASAVANTRRRNGRGSVTQSVLFPVSKFTVAQAQIWLRKHGKADHGVDTTADFHRFRQLDPGTFKAGSFRTISLGRSGVKAIIGRPL